MANTHATPKHEIKVVIVGDANVGKTSLLVRYCDNEFSDAIVNISVDFKELDFNHGDQDARILLWDTAGQERYRTITSSFYRDSDAVVIVYDITDEGSFDNLEKWIKEIETNVPFAEKIIVASKSDLEEQRVIPIETGEEWAKQRGVLFIETSSKNDDNIKEAFSRILVPLLDKSQTHKPPKKKGVSLKKKEDKESKKRGFFSCII